MDSIEQAREALTKAKKVLGQIPGDVDSFAAFDAVDTALAALSRQVEGEPVECPTCNGTGNEGRNSLCRDCDDPFAAPPVADSEALRERVDEDDAEMTWRDLALQFDGQRTQAMQILRAIRDGHDMKDMVAEFVAAPPLLGEEVLAARIARLAQAGCGPASDYQNPIRNDKGDIVAYRDEAGNVGWVGTLKAEGGPAVTEARDKVLATFTYKMAVETRASTNYAVQFCAAFASALEAALHPQSAAGEEGKP